MLLDAIKTCVNIAVWPTYISIYTERVHYVYIDILHINIHICKLFQFFDSRKAEKNKKNVKIILY